MAMNSSIAMVPVASWSSVWSIFRAISLPGTSSPSTRWASSIFVARFFAIGLLLLSAAEQQRRQCPVVLVPRLLYLFFGLFLCPACRQLGVIDGLAVLSGSAPRPAFCGLARRGGGQRRRFHLLLRLLDVLSSHACLGLLVLAASYSLPGPASCRACAGCPSRSRTVPAPYRPA